VTTLPLIDVAPLLDPDAFGERVVRARADALHAACTGSGLFYLTSHGVAQEEERVSFELRRRFLALPLGAKLRLENIHSEQFRGYTRVGHEPTLGRADRRQQLDVGRELSANVLDTMRRSIFVYADRTHGPKSCRH
jgi:isopenicillin N synthase-like dioxygenase